MIPSDRHPQRLAPASRRDAGVTILELVIASTILATVIGITISVMITGQDAYARQSMLSDCQERTRTFLQRIGEEIPGANSGTLSITNSHTELRFQVPVDHDGDGDVLSSANAVEYGATFGNTQTLGRYVRYRFVQEGSSLTESSTGIDYNANGTLTGTYVQGRIDRDLLESTGSIVSGTTSTITKYVLLRQSPLDGDANGDGVTDPLFTRVSGFDASGNPVEDTASGNQIYVKIYHARQTSNNKPSIGGGTTSIKLRNAQ